jgi:hypothetical protein
MCNEKCQLLNKPFLIVIFHFSLVKAALNAPELSHAAMVSTKRLRFLIFNLPKAEQRPLRTFQFQRVSEA